MKEEEYDGLVDPHFFSAVFRTSEHAVDPRAVAALLRRAIAEEPRVRFHPRNQVTRVRETRRGYALSIENADGVAEETFGDVVNATWFERLPLDRPLGIAPPASWSHRYKFGNRVHVPLEPEQLPSCTMVQGPFGDVVNFRESGMFLSWYPIGRTGMSTEEVPPSWHDDYVQGFRDQIFRRSYATLRERVPLLTRVRCDPDRVDPTGGVIYALGTTDVDDAGSPLHNRYEIGIQSRGRYHSVDTGKYTLVPYWGVRIADRVEGLA
jgi:hypothetical protein